MKKKEFNIQDLVRKNIQQMKPYSSARDEFVEASTDMVFLDANENPFPTRVNRYPDPKQQSVKVLLAGLKGIPTDQIMLGNGSDEVLDLIFRAFCEPKEDNVILLPPTYGMYSVLAELNNIETKEVLLTESFDINVEGTLKVVNENSKILFLCSPNNPSGNAFSQDKIQELVENFYGLVVIDEAYIDFSSQESWLNQLEKYPNLIVTQTMSKAFGMAGIRLGVCYASREIIEVLNKIKPPYNVNELTQQRAIERLLKLDEVAIEIENILSARKQLEIDLRDVSFIEKIYPSDANFILVKVDAANKRYNQLIDKGIVIRNRTTQPLCENTLRFTVGTGDENEKLLKALKDIE